MACLLFVNMFSKTQKKIFFKKKKHVFMYVGMCMPVEGNVDPGIQLKWPGVVVSTFTCCSRS